MAGDPTIRRVVRSHPALLASGIPNDKTPRAMVVADSGVTPIQNPLESPDLETMDTTLKALKKQMKQKIAPKTAVDTGPASGVQEQQTQAQSGPQFQQHWKHHIMEFRIDVESDVPTIQMQDTSVMMPPGSQPAPTQLPDPPQSIRRVSPPFRGKIILEFRPSLPNTPSVAIVM